jgi:hypothetical protein
MAKTMIELTCRQCGKKFSKLKSLYTQDLKKCNAGKFCSRECLGKSPERKTQLGKKGVLSSGWKGGRIYERGYRLVIAQDHPKAILKGGGLRYVREHRLIMEKHLGRYLKDNENVHHINGNPSDNRLENLMLMDNSEHTSLHIKRYWEQWKKNHIPKITYCKDCGISVSKLAIRCMKCNSRYKTKKGDKNNA